jgi:hypothetical protein
MSNHRILFAVVATLFVVCLPGCGASPRDGDFSEPLDGKGLIPGWECKTYDINPTTKEVKEAKEGAPPLTDDAEHGRCFAPKLKANQRCILSGEAVKLAPLRLYELRVEALGAKASEWHLRLLMREPCGEQSLPLFPYEAYEPTSPPMAWGSYRFFFPDWRGCV